MENKEQDTSVSYGNNDGAQQPMAEMPQAPAPVQPNQAVAPVSDASADVTMEDPGAAASETEVAEAASQPSRPRRLKRLLLRVGIPIIGLALIGVGAIAIDAFMDQRRNEQKPAKQFNNVSIPLEELVTEDGDGLALFGARSLVINGTLEANEGVVVTPTATPSAPSEGQLYYDQNRNELGYYNGSQFVYLGQEEGVTSIGGLDGDVTLGSGIAVIGGQLSAVPPEETPDGDSVTGNEITTVATGAGLVRTGAGTTLNPFKVGLITCANGEVIKSTGSGSWSCGTDGGTTYTAGTGISFNGTQINNSGVISFNLPAGSGLANTGDAQNIALKLQDCANGELLQFSTGNGWECQAPSGGGIPYSFTISDGTTSQDIDNGNIVTFVGNEGLQVAVSATDTVTYGIADGGVTAAKILDGTITTADLSDGSVTTAKIQDGTVANGDLANSDITINAGTGLDTTNSTVALGDAITLSVQGLDATDCAAASQVLTWDGAGFACVADDAGTTYTAGSGIAIDGSNVISNTGVLTVGGSGTIAVGGSAQSPTIGFTNGTADGQFWQWNDSTSAWELNTLPVDAEGDDIIGNEVVGTTGSGSGLTRSGAGTAIDPYELAVSVGSGLSINGSNQIVNNGVISFNVGSSSALVNNGSAQNPLVDLKPCADNEVLKYNTGASTWDCASDSDTSGNTSFTLSDGSAPDQQVANGDTVTFIGNQGLEATISATDTVTYGIVDEGVTSIKIADGTIVGGDIANGTVTNTKLANDSLAVNPGDGFDPGSGGLVALGGSTTLNLQACADGEILKYATVGGWDCAADGGDGIGEDTQDLGISSDTVGDVTTYTLTLTNSPSVQFTDVDTDTLYSAATDGGLALSSTAFSLEACGAGEILKSDGSGYECAADGTGSDNDTTYLAGTGLSLDTITNTFNVDIGAGLGTDGSDNLINTGVLTIGATGSELTVTGGAGDNPTIGFSNGTTDGQFWQWNAGTSAWELNTLPVDNDTVYTAGNGLVLNGGTEFAVSSPTCLAGEVLTWTGTAFDCVTDAVGTGDGNTTYDAATGGGLELLVGDEFSLLTSCGDGEILKYNLGTTSWDCAADGGDGTGTDTQDLSINNPTPDGSNTKNYILSLTDSPSVNFTDRDTLYDAGLGLDEASNTFAIQGLDATDCSASSQVLTWDGAGFSCVADEVGTGDGDTTYAEGNGIDITGVANTISTELAADGGLMFNGTAVSLLTTCGANQLLKWDDTNNLWECADDIDTDTDNQTLSFNDGTNVLSISGPAGSNVTITDENTTYTDGIGLTLTGTTFAVSGLTATPCDPSEKVTWNGTGFACAADDTGTDTDTTYAEGNGIDITGGANTISTELATTGGLAFDGTGISLLTSCGDDQILKYTTAGGWACADDADTNDGTGTDDQQLSINNPTPDGSGTKNYILTLEDGGSVNFTDRDTDTNTTYTAGNGLVLNGTEFAIFSQTCTGTDKLTWNGTAFICTADIDTDTNTTYTAGLGLDLEGDAFVVNGLTATACTTTEVLTWTGSTFTCTPEVLYTAGDGVYIDPSSEITLDLAPTGGLAFESLSRKLTLRNDCDDAQILKYDVSNGWECAADADTDTDTTYTAGEGLALNTGEFSIDTAGATTGQVLIYDGTGVAWQTAATATCPAGAGSTYFCQGGNSFGGVATLGTNDNNGLVFETNGTTRIDIDSAGNIALGTSVTLSYSVGDVNLGGGSGLVIGETDDYNLAIDNNEIMARNNGGTETLFLQGEGGGLNVGADIAWFQNANDSSSAFQVKNVAGDIIFDVDTLNGRVGIGTDSLTGKLDIMLADSNQTGLIVRATSGGQIANLFEAFDADGERTTYLNEAGELRVQPAQNDQVAVRVKQYDGTQSANLLEFTTFGNNPLSVFDENGYLGIGASDPEAYLNIVSGSAGEEGIVIQAAASQTADLFRIEDSGGAAAVSFDNAGNLTVSALGTSVFAGGLRIGNGADYAEFSATTGQLTFSGAARHTERIRLTAEYEGAVLDDGAQPATNGTMTSGFDMTNRMNFYNWITGQGSAQTYDIVAQVPIPENWDGWTGNNLTLSTYTDNTTNGTVSVDVIDSSGTHEFTTPQFANATPSTTDTWETTNLTLDGSYTAGDYLTLRIRLSSVSDANVKAGNIYLDYKSNF